MSGSEVSLAYPSAYKGYGVYRLPYSAVPYYWCEECWMGVTALLIGKFWVLA